MADDENFSSPAEIRHRIGANGTFSLSNVSGDIRLRGNDGEEVVVNARWEGGGDDRPLPLVVRRSETSLHVDTDEQRGWLSFRHSGAIGFDVSLPAGARVDINAVSADIDAHGLLGEQTYKTISGDLEIVDAGGRVSATTVSGDIELIATQPVEANVATTSGDASLTAPTFQPVRLRSVSGDMNVVGGFAPGPQHTVESVSGDLTIETTTGLTVDTKRGLDFTKKDHKPMVSGDGSANLRFRSLSGDARLSGFTGGATPPPQPSMSNADSLEILRALERGEIDVEEASRRLEGAGSRG
ncbi:MAG: DUF4097 family beta strand repeat-containing protein [Chloroflexota bacterium]